MIKRWLLNITGLTKYAIIIFEWTKFNGPLNESAMAIISTVSSYSVALVTPYDLIWRGHFPFM